MFEAGQQCSKRLYLDVHRPVESELPDSRLTATRLGATRRVVCASPAYLSAHGTPTTPTELSRHRCISFDAMNAPDGWRFVATAPLTGAISPAAARAPASARATR